MAAGEFFVSALGAIGFDPELMARSGQVLVAAAVARELGVADTDGSQPEPLTLARLGA